MRHPPRADASRLLRSIRALGRVGIATAAAALTAACSGGSAGVVDSTAALTEPGRPINDFLFFGTKGDTVTPSRLKGRATAIALWWPFIRGRDIAMEEFDSLSQLYRLQKGVRFVVIAEHPLGGFADSLVNIPWYKHVDIVATSWRELARDFDKSGMAPRRRGERVVFRLPSFLLIDEEGRVLARASGRPFDALNPALDGLKVHPDLVRAAGDDATVAAMRPRIEHALAAFDPATLTVPDDSAITLVGSCTGVEPTPFAVVPATGRVMVVSGGVQRISARVELTTVADGEVPNSGDDMCAMRSVSLAPRVRYDTVDVRFEPVVAEDGTSRWRIAAPLRRVTPDAQGRDQVVLFPLASLPERTLRLQGGVRAAAARVESIRAAQPPQARDQ